ncbi:glycosyltransferase [Pedobacter lithocola]|uniref:Glycosyltransferase n=1 Tax=Pedobacter lithocola TaxID=1908239 RepID=A0ABV8P9X9_9SPHI
MISIIIASTKNILLKNISKNIEDTIGVDFEIISFDNARGERGLCELYNKGSRMAKYDILCFMHEDISIKTYNWGSIVCKSFKQNEKLGLIGIAGSIYKAIAPSGWHSNSENTERTNIIQTFKFSDKTEMHHTRNPLNEKYTRVACIDGVWFSTLKKVVTENPFDEQNFKGFHAYDIDFSLQVGQHYDINVRYDILLQHFSEGNFDKSWMLEVMKLHSKWNKYLPIQTMNFDKRTRIQIEKRTFKDFIDKSLANKIPAIKVVQLLWNKDGIRRFDFKLFLKLNRYLVGKTLRL